MYAYLYSRIKKYYFLHDRKTSYEKKIHQFYIAPISCEKPVFFYKFPAVQLGNSQSEVLHIMGKPRFKTKLPETTGIRVLFYKYLIGDQKCVIQLHFKNDVLIYVNYTFRAVITDANFFGGILQDSNNAALIELSNSGNICFTKDNFIGLDDDHFLCIEHSVVTEITLMNKEILNKKLNDDFFTGRVKKYVHQNASSSFVQMFLSMPAFTC